MLLCGGIKFEKQKKNKQSKSVKLPHQHLWILSEYL